MIGFHSKFLISVAKGKTNRRILIFSIAMALISSCHSDQGAGPILLKNQYLAVKAKPLGAELISIRLLEDGSEYLWQGDPATWADHAIIQFPFIGNLRDDTYHLDGVSYAMISHGFARVSRFDIIEKTDKKVVFLLRSSARTMEDYPFEFKFYVTYELRERSILASFKVENRDDEEMLFTLGYHPGFNWPLDSSGSLDEYRIDFSETESSDRLIMDTGGLVDGRMANYMKGSSTLSLSKELFKEDAIILEGIKSSGIVFRSDNSDKSVALEFGKVPYLGLWSPKKEGSFICIEPWFGLPDAHDTKGDLRSKVGMIRLNKKESFSWNCTITIN